MTIFLNILTVYYRNIPSLIVIYNLIDNTSGIGYNRIKEGGIAKW